MDPTIFFFPPNHAPLYSLQVDHRRCIHPHIQEWDEGQLREVFLNENVVHILSIPLSSLDAPNMLIWNFNKSGSFTMRIAYFVALLLRDRDKLCSSLPLIPTAFQ
ncbi:UNVERIFIED_CONTAM: hypothetical protein Sradi_5701200 [Sesamum radiatum]|uniref:Uncharacterized protein n=1 Tax=Sesamum radiatum TaxID=300843 RepID=A0AAW2L0V9_SESRA